VPHVFVTGGTGYVGARLVTSLVARGHSVRVLTRVASRARVPPGAEAIVGDALDAGTYQHHVDADDTLVHLVGTPHPSPAKAAEFQRVDLPSVRAAVSAASLRGVRHFVYVSVAHPAPVMRAYIDVRRRGEAAIAGAQLPATILRPWYVLGPGHQWPRALVPVYALARLVPAWRESATRLGFVTIDQMVGALIWAVEHPPAGGTRVMDVAAIRRGRIDA
jgi:nucleoside-diphosphate-sugar epimerase